MVVLSGAVVLENSVGGNAVMAAQLEHLLEITQRTSVSVRVLPWSVGAHGGMGAANSFNLLEFPAEPRTEEPLGPPLVYVNTLTGAMYLNKPDEVSAYQLVWDDDLERQALNEARQSRGGARDHPRPRQQGPAGPILTFARGEWTAFLHGAAAGEFDA